MSDKPRRPFWQVHLSTALIVSFCAAGLLWLNLTGRQKWPWPETYTDPYAFVFGWPMIAYTDWTPALINGIPINGAIQKRFDGIAYGWNYIGLVFDIFCFLMILFLVGVFLEYLIRRREDCKP